MTVWKRFKRWLHENTQHPVLPRDLPPTSPGNSGRWNEADLGKKAFERHRRFYARYGEEVTEPRDDLK